MIHSPTPPHISRILTSIILIVIALIATKSLWLQQGFSVLLDYEAQKPLGVQIFFSTDSAIPFSERTSVRKTIQEGKSKATIFIHTCSKIAKFRIDAGEEPGRFVLQNVRLLGRSEVVLDLDKFSPRNIEHYNVTAGEATFVSTHRDPYLVYREPILIEGCFHIRWSRAIIVTLFALYLAFVVVDMWRARRTVKPEKVTALKNIEFLRVLFTLFVLVTHFFYPFKIWNSGGQAVQFFFLLSGYLLALTYRPERRILDIAVNRYIRFVPLVVFGGLLSGGEWKSFQGLWMLQNTGLTFGDIPNAPAWYIAVLFWCTLFFIGLMKAFDKKQLLVILAVIGFAAMLMHVHCPYKANTPAPDRMLLYGFLARGLLRGLACMSIGMILAHISHRIPGEHVKPAQKLVYTVAELAVLMYIIWSCFDRAAWSESIAIRALSHVVLLYLFVLKRGLISSMLECVWIAKLARYSLSIYLTHWLFVTTVRRYVMVEHPGWMENHVVLSITAAIIGSCIVGVLAHHLVEKPCTRYLTNFINWMKLGIISKV